MIRTLTTVGLAGVALVMLLTHTLAWPHAQTVGLRPIIVADGRNSLPCDGQGHWTAIAPIHANVVKAYLFFSMSPNGVNGADVMLGDPNWGNNPIAEIHQLHASPSQGIQGEHHESFLPNHVYVAQLGVVAVCWGGGYALAYADVWVE